MTKSLTLFLGSTALFTLLSGVLSAQNVPEILYDSAPNLLKLPPDLYLGEVAGVATNSKGNIFVFTRTGSTLAAVGGSRVFTRGGARLFEFGPNGTYIREIGQEIYGFLFAHAVRVDAQDDIWVVDEGSNMVIKFGSDGHVLLTLGRKPESVNVPARANEGAGRGGGLPGAGIPGDSFNRPSDVAWDAAGNIFVADGNGNSRIAKFDKNGAFLKSWGSKGSGPGQFNGIHTMAIDAQGNVYAGDRLNKRIQVFDNNGTFKTQYANVGTPYAMCITPGPHQYLYTSNSNASNPMDDGEIYKMELDGKILGKFGRAGKLAKEFGQAHELDCRRTNEILVGEVTNWRVQKLTLRP